MRFSYGRRHKASNTFHFLANSLNDILFTCGADSAFVGSFVFLTTLDVVRPDADIRDVGDILFRAVLASIEVG
jgi:hypothetical protein